MATKEERRKKKEERDANLLMRNALV